MDEKPHEQKFVAHDCFDKIQFRSRFRYYFVICHRICDVYFSLKVNKGSLGILSYPRMCSLFFQPLSLNKGIHAHIHAHEHTRTGKGTCLAKPQNLSKELSTHNFIHAV